MGLLKRLVSIGMPVVLAACATTQERVSTDALAKIKKVAVMSLTANEFHRQYTGFTVFGNESEMQDISAWKVDDEYETQIRSVLSKVARFDVIQVPYERKDFYSVYDINGPWDAPAYRTPKWTAVEEKLKAYSTKNSVDGIILILKRESNDFLASTNQYFRGAGFYVRGLGNTTGVSVLHLLSSVVLVDGQTGKPLATRILARSHEGWPGTVARAAPMMSIAPVISRAKLAELSQETITDVRAKLIDLPKDAWEPTLKALLASGG